MRSGTRRASCDGAETTRASIQVRPVIFSCHFWAVKMELMMGGRTALTALALTALMMARAAD